MVTARTLAQLDDHRIYRLLYRLLYRTVEKHLAATAHAAAADSHKLAMLNR